MKEAPATTAKRHTHNHGHTHNSSHNHTRNDTTASTYAERLDAIRAALLNAGIEPQDLDAVLAALPDADGKLVRFSTASKRRSKNGWLFALFDQGLPVFMTAGDWSTGAEARWIVEAGETFSDDERRKQKRRMADARQARETEQANQWELAAVRAAHRWHDSTPANPTYPYLLRKGVQAHSARQQGRELVLLLTDFTGKAWSLQTIDEAGNKRLMAGGKRPVTSLW